MRTAPLPQANGDGHISKKEFRKGVEALKISAPPAEVNALFDSYDADGSGTITIDEFCELSKTTGLSKSQMRSRFRDVDIGSSGHLKMGQMREVLIGLREEGRTVSVDAPKPSS